MKSILIITPYCPYPPYKLGGIHALFNILKENINKLYKIDLLYYDKKDEEAETEVSKYVDNIIYQDLRKKINVALRIESMVKHIPYGIFQYNEDLLSINNKYDKVIFDQPLSMNFVNKVEAKEKVLMSYDSMVLYFNRKADVNSIKVIRNVYNKIQSKFYLSFQKKQFNKFDKIIFVSKYDSIYEGQLIPSLKSKLDYINLGVDSHKFDINGYSSTPEKSIIFTGIMNYAPNKDAALFFAKKVLPELLKIHQNLKFYIVGKNPDEDIKKLANKNIIVTGFVEDIVKYVSEATVYVSPLRFGTGMKNKILEAMSTSKAIVASSISLEGIDEAKHGENMLIANTVKEWVEHVDRLLNDYRFRKKLGIECRKIILKSYNWNNSFKKIFD